MPKDVISYADKNYQQKKALFDVIYQCVEDVKYEISNTGNTWNLPVEHMKGVTVRIRDGQLLEVTYHRYEVTTVEGLARLGDDGKKFIKDVTKEIKKRFKKYTGKSLTLKEHESPNPAFEKHSRLTAETSWLLGSSRYGHGARPVGRYLVKDIIVYNFSAEL